MKPLGLVCRLLFVGALVVMVAGGCKKDSGPVCGDGVIEGDEVCDSTNLAGETCESISGEADGELRCAPDCLSFEDAACHVCGNGELEGSEDCEGDTGGTTCEDLGYAGGSLTCTVDCHYDESHCWRCDDGVCQSADGETRDACPSDCGWYDVAVGYRFSCGLIRGTGPFCWGEGVGPLALLLNGGTRLESIVNGFGAMLGTDDEGVVWMWFQGNPTAPDTPELAQATEISAFGAGGNHYCFTTADGQAWCNGTNESGQLGDGTTDTPGDAVPVIGLDDVISIAAGAQHSCAVSADGRVWCWGEGTAGKLGDGGDHDTCDVGGTIIDCAPSPVQAAGITDAVTVTAGGLHTCATTSGGEIWCWGLDDHGQVGDGPESDTCTTTAGDFPCRATPVQVAGLTDVTQASAGNFYTCAVYGELVNCWGQNANGQLGNNSTMDEHAPVSVPILRVRRVVAADTHTCAVCTDGGLQCWGQNDLGQLGDSTFDNSLVPVDVADSSDMP